ncbi:caspase, EACC1-associated type [Nostoc sp.]|uniref:caspase, EACC1-associated type n=1 Tax=Nostoc sp. TaxID=1180 RepID=UPI002FF5DDAF
MAKVALLIGVSEYEPGLNPLPAAVKDVEAMQQVLLHPEMGGFTETDIMVLKNPQRQDMEEAIENLFAHRQKDDLLVLFFSGHGIKDDTGRLFLATRTTRKTPRGDLIRSSAVAASVVHESMSRSRSKRQVVILDSCFSGAFAEGLSAKDDGSVNIREQLGGEGRAVLTSSSSTQYSFEQQGSDLSIYTRYLIEGITTGAADLDEDGVVSIDELHEYASRKVREIQPTMKPEIYTSREGFKIRLTKVPQGDPKQKYRKEVARYSSRGDVSFVGRKTLDALRSRLGLSEIEATAIEDEMLAVARQEFKQKLQQYERDFSEALQQQVALTEDDINMLRLNLQQILGLRNEDTMPIEAQVKARIEAYKQHLQLYRQSLAKAMRQEYPLSQPTRHQLQQMQYEWQLKDEDLAAIENSLTAEVEAYRQKLQQFEQAFTKAVQQEYPLSQANHNQLWQQQQLLGLKAEDIYPITARITAEREAYQQKLQQYEQVITQAIEHQYPFTEEIREELRRYQHVLEIRDEEVAQIEEKVIRQRNTNQFQTNPDLPYQTYHQTYVENLPLQHVLEIRDEEVAQIEEKVVRQRETNQFQTNPDLPRQTYHQPYAKKISQGTLVLKIRQWQFLVQILLVLGLLGGIGFIILRILNPDPLRLESFSANNSLITEGDEVVLKWDIHNYQQLQKLVLTAKAKDLQPIQSITYDFSNGIPQLLGKGSANEIPSCQVQEKQELICTNVKTGVKTKGNYIFELQAFYQNGIQAQTTDVAISDRQIAEVLDFQLVFDKPQYIKGEKILFNWTIARPLLLSKVQIVGNANDGTSYGEPVTYKFNQGNITDPKLKKLCTQQNQQLKCINIPILASKLGNFIFEIKAFANNESGKNSSKKTESKIEILPKPFKIVSFTINDSEQSNLVLKEGASATLNWRVEGENINVKLLPYGNDVPPIGSMKLPVNQAFPPQLGLQVNDISGKQQPQQRGFAITVIK